MAIINSLAQYDSRAIFAPKFRQRTQNMQNIISDSEILNFIPAAFQTYFIAYVKQWEEWWQGFVPMLHTKEFFSTGIGTSVIELLTRETLSGGYRFDTTDPITQRLVSEWQYKNDIDGLFSKMFTYSNAVGNAFIKLTPCGNEIYPTVYSSTRAFITANKRNEIERAMFLDRFEANSMKGKYLQVKELRVMKDGKAFRKIKVGDTNTTITTPNWSFGNVKFDESDKERFKAMYGDIIPGEWYVLPFDNLGVYNVPNKAVAVAMADVPCYSDSSLHTALDILYSIDFNYTAQQVDMYYGKARVLIPKEMQPRAVDTSNTINIYEGYTYQELPKDPPLQSEVYTRLEMANEEQAPYFIQPDLREVAHKYIRDADLELLAMKLGVSSTTLANHLSHNGMKTATQVDSEDDTTQKTVNNKRALASYAINKMLQTVGKFYGWGGIATITWNRSSSNSAKENEQLLAEYNAGTLPLREYLKKRWRDLTDSDVEKWVKEINAQNQANAFMSQSFTDAFGGDFE